jgi:alpha-galactosidase
VKWDMNRQSCALGAAAHEYILGLYDVLRRIFGPRPDILLETCASGGNRFDLGMLCFSPQIWCSDDTDPIERLDIQGGLSYLYPQSCMGAHVSAVAPCPDSAPHAAVHQGQRVVFRRAGIRA